MPYLGHHLNNGLNTLKVLHIAGTPDYRLTYLVSTPGDVRMQ